MIDTNELNTLSVEELRAGIVLQRKEIDQLRTRIAELEAQRAVVADGAGIRRAMMAAWSFLPVEVLGHPMRMEWLGRRFLELLAAATKAKGLAETLYLCTSHGGYGFQQDCRVCTAAPAPKAQELTENELRAGINLQLGEIERLRARIAELEQQRAGVPEGWKLVPVEPTVEMIHALRETLAITARGHVLNPGPALRAALAAQQQEGTANG